MDKLYHYNALITSVYDGDTVRANVDFGFGHWAHNVPLRLYGVNTPELRGEEREQGIVARDALRELIDGKSVVIRSYKTGKYGRYLADIWFDDLHVNQWLLDKGYSEPYQ